MFPTGAMPGAPIKIQTTPIAVLYQTEPSPVPQTLMFLQLQQNQPTAKPSTGLPGSLSPNTAVFYLTPMYRQKN